MYHAGVERINSKPVQPTTHSNGQSKVEFRYGASKVDVGISQQRAKHNGVQ